MNAPHNSTKKLNDLAWSSMVLVHTSIDRQFGLRFRELANLKLQNFNFSMILFLCEHYDIWYSWYSWHYDTILVWAQTKVFILLKRSVPSEDHFIILYNSTLILHWPICKHVPLFVLAPKAMSEIGEGDRFFWPNSWLDVMVTHNLSLGIPKKLNFC